MIIRPPRDTIEQSTRDMPRDQYWRSQARQILLNLIEENEAFQKRAKNVRNQFPQFKRKSMLEIRQYASGRPIGWWDKSGNWETRSEVLENDDVQYCREIEKLTQDFGLRSGWGPEAIHKLVSKPGTYPGEFWWVPNKIMTINIEVEITSATRWNDVKKDILQEAKQQFEAVAKPMREQAGMPERNRGPDNLRRDVEILYQRLCLQRSASNMWNEGKRTPSVGTGLQPESIRDIISKTAKLLEINLV